MLGMRPCPGARRHGGDARRVYAAADVLKVHQPGSTPSLLNGPLAALVEDRVVPVTCGAMPSSRHVGSSASAGSDAQPWRSSGWRSTSQED
jgi:hypothetical protein